MRILIAEDDPVSRRLLASFLGKWGYETVVTSDGGQAWEALQQADCPQIAILDWMMPKMDGSQICRELRKRADQRYVYVILLTAKSQKSDVVTGLNSGADDYLIKPFDKFELQARVLAAVRVVELQQQLVGTRDALRDQAMHDSLTGALNRAAILDLLQREISRGQREGRTPSLAMADIDHFKSINDTYGHLVGDTVLREVIQRLRSTVRSYDSVGRYGGEEFLIVTPDATPPNTLKLAERLRASVADKPFSTSRGELSVTISLGVALHQANTGLEAFLESADTALYRAKERGRNRVELAWKQGMEVSTSLPTGGSSPG